MKVDQFDLGYLLAVANIVHLHDEPTIAADVLRENGATLRDAERMGLTEYDMDVLRPLFEDIKRKDEA